MESLAVPPNTVESSTDALAADDRVPQTRPRRLRRFLVDAMRAVLWTCAIALAYLLLGGGAPSSRTLFRYQLHAATTGWGFDLLAWEADALAQKARTLISSPIADMSDDELSTVVRTYLDRTQTIARLEAQVVAMDAQGLTEATAETGEIVGLSREAILSEVEQLRAQQATDRPIAEAAIQRQIDTILREMGIGVAGAVMPPVVFSFTESPKKLVVSPRSRIITRDAMILNPAIPLDAIDSAESSIEASGSDLSAYVTPTGGMGAFPTMVVEEASLSWILSTVAHEWVHTYLALFPLGFNYGIDQENTTINETVADLVGDEVGMRTLERYYPDLVPQPAPVVEGEVAPQIVGFNFRKEMAETRQTVDKFLRFGRVKDAEHYMEIRRLLFVQNGYNLRKLNQAYFAFHGSYGTSAAADVSTPDALGPRVEVLRDLTGDAVAFLRTVRSITDRAGLERLIAEWTPDF